MDGVRAYRRSGQFAGRLQLRIVSAEHGLLPARRPVTPYEQTFTGLPRKAIRARADELGIPSEVGKLLERPYRLALLLLGDLYLEACQFDSSLRLGGPTVA